MRYAIIESKTPDQWIIKKRHFGLWWTVGVRSGLERACEAIREDQINADLASTADKVLRL